MLYPQLKLILTDEFLDENEYIPVIVKHLILPLQKVGFRVWVLGSCRMQMHSKQLALRHHACGVLASEVYSCGLLED